MGFSTRCSRILLCLLLCVCCSAFSAQSLHVADIKVEEQDGSDPITDFSVKDFFYKNHILLAENTVVLSFLTDESAAS